MVSESMSLESNGKNGKKINKSIKNLPKESAKIIRTSTNMAPENVLPYVSSK